MRETPHTIAVVSDAKMTPAPTLAFFNSAIICMVTTDTLENYRAANRRVAATEACRESELAAGVETRRSKEATVVNTPGLPEVPPASGQEKPCLRG
jgi:hypothetical protein